MLYLNPKVGPIRISSAGHDFGSRLPKWFWVEGRPGYYRALNARIRVIVFSGSMHQGLPVHGEFPLPFPLSLHSQLYYSGFHFPFHYYLFITQYTLVGFTGWGLLGACAMF